MLFIIHICILVSTPHKLQVILLILSGCSQNFVFVVDLPLFKVSGTFCVNVEAGAHTFKVTIFMKFVVVRYTKKC